MFKENVQNLETLCKNIYIKQPIRPQMDLFDIKLNRY